jgi:hypothetical protein
VFELADAESLLLEPLAELPADVLAGSLPLPLLPAPFLAASRESVR